MQHSHYSTPFIEKKHAICLVCDGVVSPANIGGLLRLADAFGLTSVYFCNAEVSMDSPRLKRAARNTQTHVTYSIEPNINTCISKLKEDGYYVVSLEISTKSLPIQQLSLPNLGKIAVIIGSERHGISEEVLKESDTIAHIEMFGENSSMNVTQAAAIALFQFTKS